MAIATNSYGTVEEVEALARRYTSDGKFTDTTNPTSYQVETFIDRVSGIINLLLAEQGFSIPIAQADAALACDEFVVESVMDLVDAANRTGRFFSERTGGQSRFRLIRQDAEEFIETHAAGFEALGATRSYHLTYGLDWNDQDDAGEEIEPIFSRKWMRQETIDWDTG